MRKYELSRAADGDLDDIYVYAFREFGALQADVYFESLEERLSKLAEKPLLGVDASNVREGYRRFVHQRRTLYCKQARVGGQEHPNSGARDVHRTVHGQVSVTAGIRPPVSSCSCDPICAVPALPVRVRVR